jgi:hypothetical protein
MPRAIQFKLLRYALVPFEQIALIEPEIPTPKGKVIEAAIPVDVPPRVFVYRNREIAFVGFDYVEEFGDRFIVGRLAKKKEVDIGELRERAVVEITTDDWIPIWIVVDVIGQYIAVEINSRFGDLDHVVAVLQAGFAEPIERAYRHEVVVSSVTDPRKFWEIVEDYERVYRVSLRMVSPNFLNSPARVRRLLGRWKDMYNQTLTDIELKNEEGELHVTPENLAGPIDYIAIGEGDWSVEVAEANGEARRVFSSKDETETFSVEIPRASRPAEELEAATHKESILLTRLLALLQRRNEAE